MMPQVQIMTNEEIAKFLIEMVGGHSGRNAHVIRLAAERLTAPRTLVDPVNEVRVVTEPAPPAPVTISGSGGGEAKTGTARPFDAPVTSEMPPIEVGDWVLVIGGDIHLIADRDAARDAKDSRDSIGEVRKANGRVWTRGGAR